MGRRLPEGGMPFDYITTMIMVDNWLPNFDMNEQIKEVNPNARYRNEHVSLWSIKESNRQ